MNKEESCYQKAPRMCRVYAPKKLGVPIRANMVLKSADGQETKLTRREYKALRSANKENRRKMLKAQKV